MSFTLLLFLTLAAACIGAFTWLIRHSIARPYARILVPGFALAWLLLGWQTYSRAYLVEHAPELLNRPVEVADNGYVTSSECQACHPGKYASWHKTYHRTMTQVAAPATVTGDFSGQVLEFDGVRFRPYRDQDRFYVSVEDSRDSADKKSSDVYEVAMLTGSHNYQVYWYETEKPRELGQIPIVYFFEEERWIPRRAAFITPPVDILGHDETARWNNECILCHTTNGREEQQPGLRTREVDTRASEFGIACEACHGPAEAHVRRYRNPLSRYLAHFSEDAAKDMVQPGRLSAERSTHICGQCHSIQEIRTDWRDGGSSFRPGDLLTRDRRLIWGGPDDEVHVSPDLLRTYYWNDGVVRVRGREFNDVLRSPCFESGTYSCLTCHSLHKDADDGRSDDEWTNDLLRPSAIDGKVCLDCHQDLQKPKNLAAHTRHDTDSSGSACMNCHMPNTNVGFLRGMRNHRITVPRVQDSLATGRPLACNQCHLDQTLAWSGQHLVDWYGQAPVDVPTEHQNVAASLVWMWSGDPGQRALGAWNLRWPPALAVSGRDWTTPHLLAMLEDDYPGIRQVALRSLEVNGVLAKEAVRVFGAVDERREQIAAFRADRAARPSAKMNSDPRPHLLLVAPDELDAASIANLKRQRDPAPLTLAE